VQDFDSLKPSSLGEALRMMSAGRVKPLAGGTDLMVDMKPDFSSRPTALSLSALNELRAIEESTDSIILGSLVTHAQIVDSQVTQHFLPLLVQGCATVGSPQIRHVGTLGGNIMNASPAADSVPPLVALGAEIELTSATGRRVLPLEEVITGPGETLVQERELLTRIIVPKMKPHEKYLYRKLGQRKALACCIASLAVRFVFDEETRLCSNPAVAFGAVAPVVRRIREVEALLDGRVLEPSRIASVAREAGRYCRPISDVRASAGYRTDMCQSLLYSTLCTLAS
jgi:xanthine dehydrogenase FAD-binding subunit